MTPGLWQNFIVPVLLFSLIRKYVVTVRQLAENCNLCYVLCEVVVQREYIVIENGIESGHILVLASILNSLNKIILLLLAVSAKACINIDRRLPLWFVAWE